MCDLGEVGVDLEVLCEVIKLVTGAVEVLGLVESLLKI